MKYSKRLPAAIICAALLMTGLTGCLDRRTPVTVTSYARTSYETGKMTSLGNGKTSFEQKLTGKGNRLEFCIQGNNSGAAFSVTVVDSKGGSANFLPARGNYDLVFTDYRVRRITIDFDGDKPERGADCDFNNVKKVIFTLIDDPGGEVLVGEAKLDTVKSLSAEWEKRKSALEAAGELSKNEVPSDVVTVDDVENLRAIRDKLKAENGDYGTDFIRADGDRFVHGDGSEFIAIGTNYYGFNIWQPSLLGRFSPDDINEDLSIIAGMGLNTVRFAFSSGVSGDEKDPGKVCERDILKIDIFLQLARKHGIRVILVGLDGNPPSNLSGVDKTVNNDFLTMLENRFESTAAIFKDDPTILAWNIYNEFGVGNRTKEVDTLYNEYRSEYHAGQYQDYESFKLMMADNYVRRLSSAVRRGSGNHMVTCGTLQYSFPMITATGVGQSAGADPTSFYEYVDFLCPHFYPLYSGNWGYPSSNFHRNLQSLRAWVSYCKSTGKPILLEEFGAPGGGSFWNNYFTQNQQLQWTRAVIDTLAADVAGFVYWPYQDTPGSSDISQWSGLVDVEKKVKAAGAEYAQLILSADRAKYEKYVYEMDFYTVTHETGSGGFNGTKEKYIKELLAFLKNRKNDIVIVRK
ncbi:MAG: cellulase family glycosylhydrolase [Firmicutes bacterium]|nr:cellulase family glycosylhydrolase [Bacillota bacterium]